MGSRTTWLAWSLCAILQVAAAFSLFVRLRRAGGVERQQINWFAYAAAATVSGTTLAYLIPAVIDTPTWFERAGFVAEERDGPWRLGRRACLYGEGDDAAGACLAVAAP